jgi:hypothetical protein
MTAIRSQTIGRRDPTQMAIATQDQAVELAGAE